MHASVAKKDTNVKVPRHNSFTSKLSNEYKVGIEDNFRGKCRKTVGIAAEFPKLIPNTLNLASQMWSDLDEYAEFPRKTYKHLRSFGEKFEQAFKVESWKKSNGKKNCLKEVTQAVFLFILYPRVK